MKGIISFTLTRTLARGTAGRRRHPYTYTAGRALNCGLGKRIFWNQVDQLPPAKRPVHPVVHAAPLVKMYGFGLLVAGRFGDDARNRIQVPHIVVFGAIPGAA